LLITLLATSGAFLFNRTLVAHRRTREETRKEAFLRADGLALYSSIGFLEEHTGHTVADLVVKTGEQTNVNAALVHLLAESHMSFPVPVSNFAGSDMFVDPWGQPFKFTIITNAQLPRALGRHIERCVMIERGIAHE
jgi:hypothetical protein